MNEARQVIRLFQDLQDLTLGVAKVGRRRQPFRHYSQLVVEPGRLDFTGEASKVILLGSPHDHHLPLLSVQRHSPVHRVAVALARLFGALLFGLGIDDDLGFIGHRLHNLSELIVLCGRQIRR